MIRFLEGIDFLGAIVRKLKGEEEKATTTEEMLKKDRKNKQCMNI